MKNRTRSPLRWLDLERVGEGSRRETRNREVHFPPASVYRWWARRTTSVNDEIISAVERLFGRGNLLIADPFAGGGVIPMSALSRGHRVYAQDVNPWAVEGLITLLRLPTSDEINRGFQLLQTAAEPLLDRAYTAEIDAEFPATVVHTFRVAVAPCSACGLEQRLFPYAMVTLCQRKERDGKEALLACPLGHLFRGFKEEANQACPVCDFKVTPTTNYLAGRIARCPSCGATDRLDARADQGGWRWEAVLFELVAENQKRVFCEPTKALLSQSDGPHWKPSLGFGEIHRGQETAVLRRHGFNNWEDLYPARQRVVMENLLGFCEQIDSAEDVRSTLRMAIIGVAEMAGLASRWDRWYLKSYETMARHRFNFTTLTVEPNVWGCAAAGRGTLIRRVRMMQKASDWLQDHLEKRPSIQGPLSSTAQRTRPKKSIDIRVVQGSSERIVLPRNVVDVVLTDPPYHDDVQYGELSEPLRAWARLGNGHVQDEAVANGARKINGCFGEYSRTLARIFRECRRVLQPNGHLIFSFANREPRTWAALFEALQAAGFRASGYVVVHSENETHFEKNSLRSCNRDLILDVIPAGDEKILVWGSAQLPQHHDDEQDFLARVAAAFQHVGDLSGDWKYRLVEELCEAPFLMNPPEKR